ncbi:MAG: transcription antitermination factor NusB [Nocardiopsis sp. BM-2018]|nr:MAG: transcription antitermination factor NusB [Nocardiopsis sp. BM-2018]
MARRRARELAFQALFQADRGGADVLDVWEEIRVDLVLDDEEDAYGEGLDAETVQLAERLVRTFAERREAVDAELEALIEGWTFGQMAQTDLNVLRLALAERIALDVPGEVTVEMAVRLAKKYGGEDSGRFVNGVLAKVLRRASEHGAAAR